MTHADQVKKIAKILKKNFPDVGTSRSVHIAFTIIEALEEPPSKVETKPDARVP
jgi:hypothetical protein